MTKYNVSGCTIVLVIISSLNRTISLQNTYLSKAFIPWINTSFNFLYVWFSDGRQCAPSS